MDIPDIDCIVQIEIDYRTTGKDFHYSEETGGVFGLGSKMRALEACFHGQALWNVQFIEV